MFWDSEILSFLTDGSTPEPGGGLQEADDGAITLLDRSDQHLPDRGQVCHGGFSQHLPDRGQVCHGGFSQHLPDRGQVCHGGFSQHLPDRGQVCHGGFSQHLPDRGQVCHGGLDVLSTMLIYLYCLN